MRPRFLALLPLALAACGGNDGTDPKGLTAADVAGRYALTFTQHAPCGDFAQQSGTLYARLDVTDADVSRDGTVGVAAGPWSNDPAVPERFRYTGHMDLKAKTLSLRLWHTLLTTGTQWEASFTGPGRAAGTLTDPIPGYKPYLSINGCRYDVTAVRQ